ncbi:hypothetical protein N7451_000644 [Penicillium sp. IBT 35674x]|nr:hypothetical protein N7451_000644 [Penicillium sp. IBT 35674x]
MFDLMSMWSSISTVVTGMIVKMCFKWSDRLRTFSVSWDAGSCSDCGWENTDLDLQTVPFHWDALSYYNVSSGSLNEIEYDNSAWWSEYVPARVC